MDLNLMLCLCGVVIIIAVYFYRRNKRKLGGYQDKTVLITGCDSGFGYLLCKRLDSLGFRVFAGCLTENAISKINSEALTNTIALELDVSKDESVANAVKNVESHLDNNGLWALVNNAGILGTDGLTQWLTIRDYEDTLGVNLFGPIRMTNACLPLLYKSKGRIINMTAMMGRVGFSSPAYTVSKFGLEGFSDVLRRELYHRGITVHIIEPGLFRTSLTNPDTYRQRLQTKFDSLPADIKQIYPTDVVNRISDGFQKFVEHLSSSDLNKVVDAYEHAVTAVYPKARYVVGFDAKCILIPLQNMPEWLSDWFFARGRK